MDDRQSQNLCLTSSSNLPEELIIDEIFKRLPAKSLVRLKCVSKRWKSVISSPQFAKLHLQFQWSFADPKQHLLVSEINFKNPCLLTFDYSRYDNGEIDPFYGSESDSKIYGTPQSKECLTKFELGCDLQEQIFFTCARDIRLVGSCNGLVLLTLEYDHLFLWNPITRESRRIPKPQTFLEAEMSWAFGYVSSTDDYKIVSCCCDAVDPWKKRAQTWTLRDGKWGDIILHEHYVMDSGIFPAVTAFEMVFWNMYTAQKVVCVVGFDLAEDSFEEVQVPAWIRALEFWDVLEMRGCLGVYGTYKGSMEIAMLKHYGDWDSWTKLCRFDLQGFQGFGLRGLTSAGKFICDNREGSVVILDTNQNPPTFVEIFKMKDFCFEMLPYFESLISPFSCIEA